MAHNVALLLAALSCLGIWWGWTTYKNGGFAKPSPTPPPEGEVVESSEVSELEAPPAERQGRAPAPRFDTSPTGVKGVWLGRRGDDDDD
jgi:hypothetical protein